MEGDIRSDSSEEISEEINGAATNNINNTSKPSIVRQKQN